MCRVIIPHFHLAKVPPVSIIHHVSWLCGTGCQFPRPRCHELCRVRSPWGYSTPWKPHPPKLYLPGMGEVLWGDTISQRVYELIIQILWRKKVLSRSLLKKNKINNRSGHTFAHAMTAELSWHVQNYDLIRLLETKTLGTKLSNQNKCYFCIIQIVAMWCLQTCAHALRTWLLWHVQNCVAIWWPKIKLHQNVIFIEFKWWM